MNILGISAFYHDSAAALISDGRVVAAAQEDRFTRIKHDSSFPENAARYCLNAGGLSATDLDYVAFYDKPFLKFERILETYLAYAPKGVASFSKAMPLWMKEKLFQKHLLHKELSKLLPGDVDWDKKLLFAEHHISHAASAFFPSPFREAVTLTMDGVGEWTTTSVGFGCDNNLELLKEIHFPHSLGLLYSAFTYYIGFKVNSGEYKVMGLAPYGKPRFRDAILDNLIDLKEDGSFKLDMGYFDYCAGSRMTNRRFDELFSGPPRRKESPITQREMDLAASIQSVTEEVVLRIVRGLAKEGRSKNLCLAGGVALNCVANGKILREKAFENLWVQPASGDAGGALGAALNAYYMFHSAERAAPGVDAGNHPLDSMKGSLLGPEFSQEEIENRLSAAGAHYSVLSDEQLFNACVQALCSDKALGWFQGRMEFGPRALGARSILGDARSPSMQKTLNLKIKYRESFRPFAPAVLRDDVSEWFELDTESPYMLLVADVAKKRCLETAEQEDADLFGIDKLNIARSQIPAVTHVDYSARIQTVSQDTNPRFHKLLLAFKEKTGCPVLVNTSFNVRGEPIVCSPEDAFFCFMGTEMEALAIGNCFLHKEEQNQSLAKDYKSKFDLD